MFRSDAQPDPKAGIGLLLAVAAPAEADAIRLALASKGPDNPSGHAPWAIERVAPGVGMIVTGAVMLATSPGQIAATRPIVGESPADELTMTSPSLAGRLKDGRRYRIVADRALMAPGKGEAIALESVRAAMQTEDGGRVDIHAPAALYEQTRERLTLSGGVVATTADGRSLETATVAIWQAEGGLAARSETPTRVTGPEGGAEAGGLDAAPGLDPIRLTGATSIRLNGPQAQ